MSVSRGKGLHGRTEGKVTRKRRISSSRVQSLCHGSGCAYRIGRAGWRGQCGQPPKERMVPPACSYGPGRGLSGGTRWPCTDIDHKSNHRARTVSSCRKPEGGPAAWRGGLEIMGTSERSREGSGFADWLIMTLAPSLGPSQLQPRLLSHFLLKSKMKTCQEVSLERSFSLSGWRSRDPLSLTIRLCRMDILLPGPETETGVPRRHLPPGSRSSIQPSLLLFHCGPVD